MEDPAAPPTLADVVRWERLSEARRDDALAGEGIGDGLPLARPTLAAVRASLTAAELDPDAVVATLPPLFRRATAVSVATCAVLAGCDPGMFPVVVAATRALADPAFNALGVLTTTGSAAVATIVNGAAAASFNSGTNLLGPGSRANATVGRAIALTTQVVGGAVPGLTDVATMGQPGKYTFCFAENEAESPWEPLHVARGLAAGSSAVTLIAVSGTLEVTNAHAEGAEDVLDTIAASLYLPGTLDLDGRLVGGGHVAVLLSPEWARTLAAAGLARRDVMRTLRERAVWPGSALPRSLRYRGSADEAAVRAAESDDDVLLVVAGGVGVKQTVLPGWPGTSVPVTVSLAGRLYDRRTRPTP